MYLNQSYVQTYALEPEFLKNNCLRKKSIPLIKSPNRGGHLEYHHQRWTSGYWLRKACHLGGPRGIPYDQFAIVCLFVKADKIISALTRSDLNEVFVVSEGGGCWRTKPKLMAKAQPGTRYSDPAVEKAFSFEQIKTSVMGIPTRTGLNFFRRLF